MVKERGLENQFYIDSAGLHDYHEGELPDNRMRKYAAQRGYNLDSRSRPVKYDDFFHFDLIIGMDDQNISSLNRLAPDSDSKRKIHRMTEYCTRHNYDYIPDPYYGGAKGFELVLDLLEDACEGLAELLQN